MEAFEFLLQSNKEVYEKGEAVKQDSRRMRRVRDPRKSLKEPVAIRQFTAEASQLEVLVKRIDVDQKDERG